MAQQTRDDATGGATDAPATITGPHYGYDRAGDLDHVYWRCTGCGLEVAEGTPINLRDDGCWRCSTGQ